MGTKKAKIAKGRMFSLQSFDKTGDSPVIHYLLLAFLIGLGFFILYLLKPFYSAIFGSIILAFLFRPLYDKLNNFLKWKSVAAGLTILIALIIVLIPLIFLSGTLISEAADLVKQSDSIDVYINMINEKIFWFLG